MGHVPPKKETLSTLSQQQSSQQQYNSNQKPPMGSGYNPTAFRTPTSNYSRKHFLFFLFFI